MDKETADYFFQKAETLVEKVAPHIEKLTPDYIAYIVAKVNYSLIICSILLVISIAIFGYGMYQGKKRNWENGPDIWLPIILGGMTTGVFMITAFHNIYMALLANSYPTVYALETLIK